MTDDTDKDTNEDTHLERTRSEKRLRLLDAQIESAEAHAEMAQKDRATYDDREKLGREQAARNAENDHLRECDIKSAVAHRTRLDNHLESWDKHVKNWDAHVAKCEAHMERQSKALEAIAEALKK